MSNYNISYLDIETKYRSDQVEGDWGNVESFGVSVAVVYSTKHKMYGVYTQNECLSDMVNNLLYNSDLVVGYNVSNFDYRVLTSHSKINLSKLPTFDMLDEIHKTLGYRVSLNNVASNTFGIGKSGESTDAPDLYWDGKMEELVYYCTTDVEITKRVFVHACRQGYLNFYNWNEKQKESFSTKHWADKAKEIIASKGE